ncbi:hypothetical protein ACFOYW_09065 [Gryllotalpicola reticulitermitis]|uniref:Glycosyl transferase family 2 n=1 Tax=Gryllotalpicola reticulitermitis TaxID=1184153 RepID=A0ABV8Q849_9MICO
MTLRTQLARLRPGRIAAAAEWRRAMARGRRGQFALETLFERPGAPVRTAQPAHTPAEASAVPLIMCLWNRPSRIDDVLRMLDGQQGPIDLVLWNNQKADDAHYRSRIAAFAAAAAAAAPGGAEADAPSTGALRSIRFHTSAVNMRGICRFFVARQLWEGGYRGPFIMLDDDQDVTGHFLADALAAAAPHGLAGWWAWQMHGGGYWDRRAASVGERVDYAGTGGCVCDIDIVADPAFFTELPRYFAHLEDLWMCSWAKRHGWAIGKLDTPIEFVLDETNQHHGQYDLKAEFWDYLARLEAGAAA